jgi:hypothetical protein
MKVTKEEERILEEIHRKFSELSTLLDQLSNKTVEKTLKFHNENYSINHCIMWGEIGISEIRDDLE